MLEDDLLVESPGVRRHYPGHEEGKDQVEGGKFQSERTAVEGVAISVSTY